MSIFNNFTLTTDKLLDSLVPYYIYAIVGIHVIYIIAFIGLINLNGAYLNEYNIFIQTFVCLFLLLRFNPFRKHNFKESDSHIIFGSATFLLLNLGFVEVFRQTIKVDLNNLVTKKEKPQGQLQTTTL